MCESAAYFVNDKGEQELVMDSVNYVKPTGNTILLKSIFGEQKTVEGHILEMNLTAHTILLERP